MAEKVSSIRAASWVPDSKALACPKCFSAFNFVNRKHHCRNCGGVFCGDCSSKRSPLPHYNMFDPVRVCDSCFAKIGGKSEGQLSRSLSNLTSTLAVAPSRILSNLNLVDSKPSASDRTFVAMPLGTASAYTWKRVHVPGSPVSLEAPAGWRNTTECPKSPFLFTTATPSIHYKLNVCVSFSQFDLSNVPHANFLCHHHDAPKPQKAPSGAKKTDEISHDVSALAKSLLVYQGAVTTGPVCTAPLQLEGAAPAGREVSAAFTTYTTLRKTQDSRSPAPQPPPPPPPPAVTTESPAAAGSRTASFLARGVPIISEHAVECKMWGAAWAHENRGYLLHMTCCDKDYEMALPLAKRIASSIQMASSDHPPSAERKDGPTMELTFSDPASGCVIRFPGTWRFVPRPLESSGILCMFHTSSEYGPLSPLLPKPRFTLSFHDLKDVHASLHRGVSVLRNKFESSGASVVQEQTSVMDGTLAQEMVVSSPSASGESLSYLVFAHKRSAWYTLQYTALKDDFADHVDIARDVLSTAQLGSFLDAAAGSTISIRDQHMGLQITAPAQWEVCTEDFTAPEINQTSHILSPEQFCRTFFSDIKPATKLLEKDAEFYASTFTNMRTLCTLTFSSAVEVERDSSLEPSLDPLSSLPALMHAPDKRASAPSASETMRVTEMRRQHTHCISVCLSESCMFSPDESERRLAEIIQNRMLTSTGSKILESTEIRKTTVAGCSAAEFFYAIPRNYEIRFKGAVVVLRRESYSLAVHYVSEESVFDRQLAAFDQIRESLKFL